MPTRHDASANPEVQEHENNQDNAEQQIGAPIASLETVTMHDDAPSEAHTSNTVPVADFDLDSLRLPQDFASVVGVQKMITTVPVRKPHRQEFIRVHPDEAWRLQTAVLEVKEDRETYLVDPSLWSELPGEIVPKIMFSTLNRQGVLFLWSIRLPGEDGRLDAWNQSALEAAQVAMAQWVRVAANQSLGAYEVWQAASLSDEPVWPVIDFQSIVQTAFKNRFIQSWDHPILRRLRGEL